MGDSAAVWLCYGKDASMTTLREKIASMPASQQAKIAARAKSLILEEMTLRDARKRTRKTQDTVAKRLGVGQDSISRLEKRGDMLVSTLREYVSAIGGKVRLVVEIKGEAPVELKKIGRAPVKTRRK